MGDTTAAVEIQRTELQTIVAGKSAAFRIFYSGSDENPENFLSQFSSAARGKIQEMGTTADGIPLVGLNFERATIRDYIAGKQCWLDVPLVG